MKQTLTQAVLYLALILTPADVAFGEDKKMPLHLDKVIHEVIERNPEILAARQKTTAAREKIPQAAALDDPEAGVTQWSIPSNLNITEADETWFSLSQTFPFFGKRELRRELATIEAALAEEESREVERRVVSQAKKNYYDLFFADKGLEIHHEQVTLARRFSKIAQEKFAVGEVGQQDLLRAEVALLDLSNMLTLLEQERALSIARLHTIMNRPPQLLLGTPQITGTPMFEPQEEILQREVETSPKIRIHALSIQHRKEAVSLAEQAYLPDLMAEVAYWQVHAGPNRWMASLKINLPWLNRNKHQSKIREAEAEAARAHSEYQAALNETRLIIKDLITKYQAGKRLATLYDGGILPLARQSLESAIAGYQTKKNDFLTLIAAQKDLKEFELTYYRALIDMRKNLAELEGVMGKALE